MEQIPLSHVFSFFGAIFSSLSTNLEVAGMISFVENTAVLDGGALSLADPTEVDIISTSFLSNKASFGGTVSVTSGRRIAGRFERCRFVSNEASNGGALYLSTGGTNAAEKSTIIQDSGFQYNVAGESPTEISDVWESSILTHGQ